MTRSRILLLALLLGIAGYWYYDKLQREEEEVRRQQAERLAVLKKAELQRRGVAGLRWLEPSVSDRPDLGMKLLPTMFSRTDSAWDSAERSRFDLLLPSNAFDVLVVPFQVRDYGLDRTSRSLMAAQLAGSIRLSGARVPDTYLVLRALGESKRNFDPGAVYPLARRLGVSRIIWPFAGHDHANRMSVLIRAQQGTTPGYLMPESMQIEQYAFTANFTDESPPVDAFLTLLPGIMQKLGYAAATPVKQPSHFDAGALPASPLQIATETADAARDAFYFLLLAALTPNSAQRTQERYAEKTMLALQSLSEEYPDYQLLRARALMLMGLRPAALNALGQPRTPEEKTLLAMLNGNFPDVVSEGARIKSPLKKIMAELDLAKIQRTYGVTDTRTIESRVKAMGLPGNIWPLLMARGLADNDGWAQFENLYLKSVLDAEFPLPGFTAEGLLSGAATVGDSTATRNAVDLSVHNHIRQLVQKEPAKVCCGSDPARVSKMDYLDLLDAMGFDNLARRIDFFNVVQGRPEDALSLLARLDAVYKGHPHMSVLRAEAQLRAAVHADDAAKLSAAKSAYVDAFNAFYWEQGQTRDAARAYAALIESRRSDYGSLQNMYMADIPFRSYYPPWDPSSLPSSLGNLRAALASSTLDYGPVEQLRQALHNDTEFGELLKSLDGRFKGNTGLIILRARNDLNSGNRSSAEEKYREAIRIQPTVWNTYEELSELLLHEGQASAAAALVMRYPGFDPKSSENKVGVSNAAAHVASNLFWAGEFELAKPLMRIAANGTGAAADLMSQSRLKLLAGDYAGALVSIYERAHRYNSSYAYRDYLAMLHAIGLSKAAGDGFTALIPQQVQPHIWEAALVGHRKSNATQEEIIAWLQQDALRGAGATISYPAMYLLRSALVDRLPAESTVASLAAIDRKVWKISDGYGHVVRPSADGRLQYILGPLAPDDSVLPLGVFERSEKIQIQSDFVYFAKAYGSIRAGKYDAARRLLEEAASFYDMSHADRGYMLPYFAYAAARARNVSGIEKTLAAFRVEQRGFDYFLAQAVIAGVGGKTQEAVGFLVKARYRRPFTEMRPLFSEYEYAEIAEWLHEATGNSAYRNTALQWARICQQAQPWFSWAYAMEAKLSQEGPNRRRAIAMAYYLDQNSERLKSIPKSEIEQAVRDFAHRNPFRNMQKSIKENAA